ncbi:MAG: hypothetical protein U0800_02315 [Isosphaeraceae bacterium]
MPQVLLALLAMAPTDDAVVEVGQLAPAIREASGIAASRRHPGIFWVHNDSGNPPEIFAIRRDGTLVRKYRVGVPNIDWEDIAVDDRGHLYIGDIGNNDGRLALRMIYRVDEPDPDGPDPGQEPLKVSRAWFYGFDGAAGRFDAESLFLLDGRFAMISKHRDGKQAELFALPIEPTSSLTKPSIPARIATLPGCDEAVTGAAYDEASKLLAVLSGKHVRIYRRGDREVWVELAAIAHPLPEAEGICWDGRGLLIVAEDRRMARVDARAWSAPRRGRQR